MCSAGIHGSRTVTATPTLLAGPHQIVVQYFNGQGAAVLGLVITRVATNTDVSASFTHDPAGPCNADCAPGGCNTAQQYLTCAVAANMPVGGVCTRPLSVTP